MSPLLSSLAPEQEPILETDAFWQGNPARSVDRPADMVPHKPRVDVVLVGSAYAPRSAPVRSLLVRMIVSDVDKSAEIFCPRTLDSDGSVRDGAMFTAVPLRYELAAGGPDTQNPVGIAQDVDPAFASRKLPQIQPPGYFAAPREPVPTLGFGPIAPFWPSRREKLGALQSTWADGDYHRKALGEEFDYAYFQVAPRDQQLDVLRADERIVLENLSSEHPRLVTKLPGLVPLAFLDNGGALVQIALRADTLLIDTDRGICTVTFRGQVALTHPTQQGTIFVALQEPGQRIGLADVQALIAEAKRPMGAVTDSWLGATPFSAGKSSTSAPTPPNANLDFQSDMTTEINAATLPKTRVVMPFVPSDSPSGAPPAPFTPPHFTPFQGLPFASSAGATPPRHDDDEAKTAVRDLDSLRAELRRRNAPPAEAPSQSDETTRSISTSELLGGKSVLPFSSNNAQPLPVAPAMSPLSPTSLPLGGLGQRPLAGQGLLGGDAPKFGPPPAMASLATPAMPTPAMPTNAMPTPAMPTNAIPTNAPQQPAYVMTAPAPSLSQPAQSAPLSPFSSSSGFGGSSLPSSSKDKEPEFVSSSHSAQAAHDGVAAASNAAARSNLSLGLAKSAPNQGAASATNEADKAARASADPVEMIWFEPSYVPRMRKNVVWASMFRPAPKASAPERGKPPPAPPSAESIEEAAKGDIANILSRGTPSTERELSSGEGNGAEPSALHLVSGTLAFPFDEMEHLKATVAAASPLATSDKKLKEVLDMAGEVMKMPLQGAPEVVVGFIQRVRDAWTNANRLLPPDYLVTHPERLLLNQRHYQKRELLDEEWIRALLSMSGNADPIPAYIPAKLSKRLPLFRQFGARLIVEVLPQQDMYEAHPLALRVVSLARLLTQDASSAQKTKR